MPPLPMVRLTAVGGAFAAHVLAARLTDEGFDVELRGPGLHSGYSLTLGDLGQVDLFVPADQVNEASYVLLVGELDSALDEEPDERHRRILTRHRPWVRAGATAVLLVALLGVAQNLLR
jgi:hypothetical protein